MCGLLSLLTVTLALGHVGIGLVRPLFILGCIVVAWRALKVGPGVHAEVVIVLFVAAPFLRRIVDVSAGYNPSGIMLVGPLLALAIPLKSLQNLLIQRQSNSSIYAPYLIMGACLTYGWAISAFQGDLMEATVSGLKLFIPMLYAVYLIQRSEDCEEIINSVTRAFLFVTPILGAYGIFQYVNPQSWDRYWMINSPMLTSIGKPEPMQVRVFSTMNSPASFATFATCGLLLYGFCRRGLVSVVLIIPICIGLLLSFYRTAWITIAISVVLCFLANSTRSRAIWLTVCLLGAGALAILTTPFGPEIVDRLMTLTGDPAQDGSGHERLREFMHLYSDQARYLFGRGLAGDKVLDPQLIGIDGQLIASAVFMGIIVGNIHVLALIWACLQGGVLVGSRCTAGMAGGCNSGDRQRRRAAPCDDRRRRRQLPRLDLCRPADRPAASDVPCVAQPPRHAPSWSGDTAPIRTQSCRTGPEPGPGTPAVAIYLKKAGRLLVVD